MNEKKYPPMPGQRRLRKEYAVTMDELEKVLYCNKRTINKWISGEAMPTKSDIDRICAYFDCKEEDLR